MQRVTKALVIAGAAAMVIPPMAAGAAGSTSPVLAQGVDERHAGGLDGLVVGGVVLGGAVLGLLVGGASKSN